MIQSVMSPAAQFHLALLDDEAQRYAGVAPVSYLADLFPVGNRDGNDYARLILDHAGTWLGFNTRSYRGQRTQLESDAREMLTTYMLDVTAFIDTKHLTLNTVIEQGVYGLIHAELHRTCRLKSDQLTLVALALTSLMWLKYVIYDETRDDEYVRLASRMWLATAS